MATLRPDRTDRRYYQQLRFVAQRLTIVILAILMAGCSGKGAQVIYPSSGQNLPNGQTTTWNFDADAVGSAPRGTVVFSGTWAVRAEADAPSPPNVLCQTGTAEFPALSLGDMVYADVVLSTRFKPISGREDQAAGLLFRIQDKDNYYILRGDQAAE